MTAGKQIGEHELPDSLFDCSSIAASFDHFQSQAASSSEVSSPVVADATDPNSIPATNIETSGDINQEFEAFGDMHKETQASQPAIMPIMSEIEMDILVSYMTE